MNVSKIRWMVGSVGLAASLASAASGQCFAEKIVDDDYGILNFMGSAVDMYSTRVVLGAPSTGSGGRVFFFERTGPREWSEISEIASPDGGGGDLEFFGRAVAIYGDFAAVGAPMLDVGSDENTGRVYIYRRVTIFGTPFWILDEVINNPSPDDDDNFGASLDVTIIGSTVTVAVGCPGDDLTGAPQAGRVRIYSRNSAGDWSLQDTVVANTAQTDARFGTSVAFDGQRLLVGAPLEDVSGEGNAGAAYLFTQSGTDWGTGLRFVCPAANRDPGDVFGTDVAISGTWLAIGAPGDDVGLETNAGAIYMYRRGIGGWTFMQRVLYLAPDAFDEIGEQIDLAGGVLVAGAPSENYCAIWTRDADGDWNPAFPFIATDPPASGAHSFGSDVALSHDGEYVLIGDAADDLYPDGGGAGSAYVFTTDQNPGNTCPGGLFDGVPFLEDGETYYGCNSSGTDGATSCVTSNGDAWYQFIAPCNGVLALTTCGTHDLGGQDRGIDSVLSVHTGCPGVAANQIACNDDAPNGNFPDACGLFGNLGAARDAALKVSVNAGQNYKVRVASFGASGPIGLFVLNVDFTCCRVDWDGNGVVNSTDVSQFINDWFTDQVNGTLFTDFDGNGVVNSTDVSMFINEWFEGCSF